MVKGGAGWRCFWVRLTVETCKLFLGQVGLQGLHLCLGGEILLLFAVAAMVAGDKGARAGGDAVQRHVHCPVFLTLEGTDLLLPLHYDAGGHRSVRGLRTGRGASLRHSRGES